MKIPNQLARSRSDGEAALTPLIDVVFLLLVFFIYTASFQIAEYSLPAELSAEIGQQDNQTEVPPPEVDFEDIVVRILWDGSSASWTVNDQPMFNLSEVKQHLAKIAQIKQDAPIIIHPDPATPLGFAVDAFDLAKTLKFDQVQYAVNDSSN